MAIGTPWCFDVATQTLGELEQVKKAYLEKFQEIHEQIDSEEWGEIVADLELSEDPRVAEFVKMPGDPVYESSWWKLDDPNCWGFQKQYLKLFDISETTKEIEDIIEAELRSQINLPPDKQLPQQIVDLCYEVLQGGYTKYTLEELSDVISVIKEYVNALNKSAIKSAPPAEGSPDVQFTGVQEFSFADQFLFQIENKINQLICPDDEYFKDHYLIALQLLAQPKVERQGIHNIIDSALEAAQYSPILLMNMAARVADHFHDGEEDADDMRKRLEKAIEEEFEEAFADNITYQQQCMMLTFIKDFIEAKATRDEELGNTARPVIPYAFDDYNAPIQMAGEPFGFLNRLAVEPSQAKLFDLKPEVLSSMVPHIRFFKVEVDEEGNDEETEIQFDSNSKNSVYTTSDALRRQRGYGVGMKSFDFSYEGTDPFSVKKAINAKLTMYASTFDELLRERGADGKKYRYADLALKTGGWRGKKPLTELERENLDKLNFRLKVTLGWSVPDNSVFRKLDDATKDAIYNSFITLYLTPIIHNFDFDETGATTFSIEYMAYIEDAFSQSSFNIFSKLTRDSKAREAIMNYYKEMDCDVANSEEFKEFRKKDEEAVSQINTQAFQEIIKQLQSAEQIYYLNLPHDDVKKLVKNPLDSSVNLPVMTTLPATSVDLVTAVGDSVKTAKNPDGTTDRNEALSNLLSAVAVSPVFESIPYFFLGDLIDVVMKGIEKDLQDGAEKLIDSNYLKIVESKIDGFDLQKIEKQIKYEQVKLKSNLQQFRKMRVILGPMEMFSPLRDQGTILCSISDLPISLSYFFHFMSDRVLSKEIINYPFTKFLKDIVNDLVVNFLNSDGCTRVDNSQKIKLNSTTVCAYNMNKNGAVNKKGIALDDISLQMYLNWKRNKSGAKKKTGIPVLTLSGKRDTPSDMLTIDRMMSYYVFTVGRKSPVSNYVANREFDEKNGIFHYMIGENKGIVKNITLEKTTATGLKEVRFEQEGYNGLEQLREVYNAKIETFLNVQTFPGVYVYVEPAGFAPNTTEDLTRFGIGGYCMVVKTEHSIAPGTADTTLHTVWVASKHGNNEAKPDSGTINQQQKRVPEGSERIKKCLVGPHHIGMLVTRRGKYKGLSDEEAGKLGSEVVASGVYEV